MTSLTPQITFLALLIIAVSVLSSCYKAPTNGSSGQIQTPSPTPLASPPVTPAPEPGDTVIVIKDGSVDITTNSCCKDHRSGYKCDDFVIQDVFWKKKGGQETPCANVTASSKVTIGATGGSGGSKDIVVKGNPNHVMITFDKPSYPSCPGKKHNCGSNNVESLAIDGVVCTTCTKPDECRIRISKQWP
jgi:hypothetical protein